MKIIHVTHRAWPVIGGSETYVHEIARRQLLAGHQVTIICTDADALSGLWDRGGRRLEPEIPDQHQGVRICRLPVRRLPPGARAFFALRRLTWLVSGISVRAALLLARYTPWVPGLARALTNQQADLLFAWNILLEGLTAAVAREAQQRHAPWVAVPLLHLGQPRFYTMRHQLHLLRQATRVLTQTQSERAFLVHHGLASERVHVVSPGVDPGQAHRAKGDRFRQNHRIEGPLVVTLGALTYDKGTTHLLAAAQTLWDEGHRLVIAMIGPMDRILQLTVMRLSEQHRMCCLHLQQVSEDEKWDAVDAADVVALPSSTESFGIVFLEAWARGKPVIGANAGAVRDVVQDGVDGFLVEFGDIGALADALRRVLDSPALAAQMGRRGKEKVQRQFTWDLQYDHLEKIVDELALETRT